MKIYVGNLWPRVTRKELQKLIDKAMKRPWYMLGASRVSLQSCNLMQMVEHGRGTSVEYGGVIDVYPTRLGWQVVEVLDGMVVHGHQLKAHKWFPRKGLSDRRVSFIGDKEVAIRGADRRYSKDRRRHMTVQTLGQPMTLAVKGFERSYGS